jgi:hypothetical protein
MKTNLCVELTINSKDFKFYVPVDTTAAELEQAMEQLAHMLSYSLRESDIFD